MPADTNGSDAPETPPDSDQGVIDPEIAKLPFEAALNELESIIGRIEQGEISLEASLAAYQRGDQLVQRCKAVLGEAEQRVRTLRIDEIPGEGRPGDAG
ncbi:MAG: exodeoxyribonuclease VII small subunit [Phycisphaerales bacterium]|jgi:exodeoxyribonuclease VII small subunit|nr:exodeoxyribonuclease VII small subunit [Phycisphaerales bacterium]